MKPQDWINLAGLILGPVIAVFIAGWRERATRQRDEKLRILAVLMAKRLDAGGVDWTAAFAVVPIYFHGDGNVIRAWKDLLANLNFVATAENLNFHMGERTARTTRLLYEMCLRLRIKITEGEIGSEGYLSKGVVDYMQRQAAAPIALVSMADTARQQFEWLKSLPRPSDPRQGG